MPTTETRNIIIYIYIIYIYNYVDLRAIAKGVFVELIMLLPPSLARCSTSTY